MRRNFIQLLLKSINIRLDSLLKTFGRLQVLTDITDLLSVLVKQRLRIGQYFVHLLVGLGDFGDVFVIVILNNIPNSILLLFQLLPVFINIFIRLANESIVHSEINLLETSNFGVLLFQFLDETAVESFLLSANFAVTFSFSVTGRILS